MKKSFVIVAAILAVLLLAGCATTSEPEPQETEVPVVASTEPAAPKTTELAVPRTMELPVPAPKAAASEQPANTANPDKTETAVPAQEEEPQLSAIDIIYQSLPLEGDITADPVPMQPAVDGDKWDVFVAIMTQSNDLDEAELFLVDWFNEYGWTPEFHAAFYNYCYARAMDDYQYVTSYEELNVVYAGFDRAFNSLMSAGGRYPDRLDLWCGFVHLADILGDVNSAYTACSIILDRQEINGGNWYWTKNAVYVEDGDDDFVHIMHDYICEWLELDDGLGYALELCKRLVTLYPEDTVILNDAGLCQAYNRNVAAAAEYWEQAHAVDPEDMIVVSNLMYAYMDLGDYERSREFAMILLMSEDSESVERGLNGLSEINSLEFPER